MKLIDILLSELPARGGWPDSKTEVMAVQDADKEIKFIFIGYPLGFERNNPQIWGSNTPKAWLGIDRIKTNYLSSDYQCAIITREQYDAAVLANPVLDRSSICDFIYGAIRNAERKDNRSDEAEAVYDAIVAGKIPGINLNCSSVHPPIYVGLEEAAKPLIKWIAENCNPHSTVIVDGGSAVLYSAENSVITDEFIKD